MALSNCHPRSHTTSLPPPEPGEGPLQGSLTARAPVQAGGAGSSPAPVAKPDLTAMVLDIVNGQLDELDRRRKTTRPPNPLPSIEALSSHKREAPAKTTPLPPLLYEYGRKRPPRIYGGGRCNDQQGGRRARGSTRARRSGGMGGAARPMVAHGLGDAGHYARAAHRGGAADRPLTELSGRLG